MVQHAERDGEEAVANKASTNVVAIDGRTCAQVITDMAAELEKVKALAPREPPVYIMLAQVCLQCNRECFLGLIVIAFDTQVYQKLGRTQDALVCYSDALDLDPKDSVGVKVITF